jgi:flagellar biosynthesis chaperone FliJ
MDVNGVAELLRENELLKEQGRQTRDFIRQLESKIAGEDNRNFVAYTRYYSEITGYQAQISRLRQENDELREKFASMTDEQKLVDMLNAAASALQSHIDNPYG